MSKIVIVEGDTPELVERVQSVGGTPYGERYAAVLQHFAPEADVEIIRPYFSGYASDALDLSAFEGVILTGSGVSWSASDVRAAPYWDLLERTFGAGLPVLGSCWGLQVGAVVLGGEVGASPNGFELGAARHIRITDAGRGHAIHKGRAASFDAVCIHRDEVTRLPEGAAVTASNDHSPVQAMVYEQAGIRFWGMQYHPELSLGDIAKRIRMPGSNMARDALFGQDAGFMQQIADDFDRIARHPETTKPEQWRYGVGTEIVAPDLRGREIANWYETMVSGRVDVTVL